MKVAVFGATESSMKEYNEILTQNEEIVVMCDNDTEKQGKKMMGVDVISPDKLKDFIWDKIYVIVISAMDAVVQQLLDMGIEYGRIDTSFVDFKVRSREQFVKDFATLFYCYNRESNIANCDVSGDLDSRESITSAVSVAEAGVYQGEFAKVINSAFKDRKIYLFDTFEGFDGRDVSIEQNNAFSNAEIRNLNNTSVDLVMSKMPYPENVIIKKGYFPETAYDVDDRFVFVNLDLDLYKPTIEGLKFFYPRLIGGGIIVVHDYFNDGYKGVRQSIDEFCGLHEDIRPFPIGDGISIAIQKRGTD